MCVSDCFFLILSAYLLGSVPFGVLMARAFGLPDPRGIGSGNIGATNLLRTGRKDVAAITLLLDAAKGAAAVWIALLFFHATPLMATVAVMMATLGHIYSPWLKFRGGKGVATTLGGVLILSPAIGGLFILLWLLVFAASRISSLSSLAALAFLPLLAGWQFSPPEALVLAMTALIAIYKHMGNLQRLLRGEEPRFFQHKEGL
jgi:glycerol-3-phosphate acyltransferase PlsY